MRHPPTQDYCGITIILSRPSRHDKKELISGWAGQQFFKEFWKPLTRENFDIRDLNCSDEFLPDTKVILALGPEYAESLRPGMTLNQLRGSPIRLANGIIIIPSYAPQDAWDRVNYEDEEPDEEGQDEGNTKEYTRTARKNWRFWLYQDCIRCCHIIVHGGLPPEEDIEYIYNPPMSQAVELLESPSIYLYFDVETDRLFNFTCIGIGTCWRDEGTGKYKIRVIVVPVKKFDGGCWYPDRDIYSFIRALAKAFSYKIIVGHNLMFDLFILAMRWKIPFPKDVFDTMISFHRLYPEVEKSLGHLISLFLYVEYHKGTGVFDPKTFEDSRKLWIYNGKDVSRLVPIAHAISREATRDDRVHLSITRANKMVRPYLTVMFQGMLVDTQLYLKKFEEYELKRKVLGRVLNLVCGRAINASSPKQVASYVYGELGCKEPDEDKTAEKTLLTHLLKKPAPSLKTIIQIRGTRKASSSMKFRMWRNNRFTCAYGIAGTDTYRLNSRALLRFRPDKGFGANAQNWNKKQRQMIVADPGKVLIQVDQAGAEALIVAWLCPDGNMRELFKYGIKPHIFVATHLFAKQFAERWGSPSLVNTLINIPPRFWNEQERFAEFKKMVASSDDWPPNERYYYMGKKTCHSGNYDIKERTFCMSILVDSGGIISLPLSEGRRFLNTYRQILFPELLIYYEDTKHLVRTEKKLYNLLGDRRWFFRLEDESYYKQWYAFRPQSTVGQITNLALAHCQNHFIEECDQDFDILQNGHDSILAQAKPEEAKFVGALIREQLQRNLVNTKGERFQMGAEVSIGENWAPYDPVSNPNGLKEVKYG